MSLEKLPPQPHQAGHQLPFDFVHPPAFAAGLPRNKKTWDEETIALLRLVGEMFSSAVERKRMELALRESEKRYRLLAENIIDVIWTTDMGLRVTYVSPSGARLVGFSQKEYLNMTLEDMLTPASFREGLRVFAEQQAIFTQRRDTEPFHWTLDVELRFKDGSTVWAEERVSFIQDESGQPVGILGVTRDIRERRSVEEALRRSEEKYIAESFERIHRSNLVGMGVLPLKFIEGQNAETLGLKCDEKYDIIGLSDDMAPKSVLTVRAKRIDDTIVEFKVIAQLNTEVEVNYYRNGGILHTVLRNLVK